jgi:hypothetical protein
VLRKHRCAVQTTPFQFPGLEEAFGLIVSPGEFVERTVDPRALDEATRTLNEHEAVRKAVPLIQRLIGNAHRRRSGHLNRFGLPRYLLPHPARLNLLHRRDDLLFTIASSSSSEKLLSFF